MKAARLILITLEIIFVTFLTFFVWTVELAFNVKKAIVFGNPVLTFVVIPLPAAFITLMILFYFQDKFIFKIKKK
ncbi:TPA: hypothetical protein DDW69_03905 [candidate division CPR2 bacterium]|uniref:Uncharacterized protein n=1 Tax=candidate division CPR2 bacterium GW2011_GWC1_41_48 TaxID=1618344 RepID=A0A0G0W7N3_UNCC2|nr:MAG: hypothetical protein UT47_C0003G0031 [candidate division CPR2 bacterium GW2011_GWC2_39_35]KKR27422.1 MAG: hypothetical protein UT59_C0057G0003 [candidate division CPR2 bacterium GW2011_GWD1_39_7]KKR28605.1 MAG: hypothetical protein UT60_C0016G0005 [candidate division CPR2 bacterium GW2011_GWD2_39_7]KKS08970.1 MAG: hypothetical protein UU65_C0003G0025 [candidate division CPR2 bacterium GW2011_GWC1_41_48]OGB58770.1 MAG: hypothetical protein A2Y27_03795 [candidate division CPR2 bacterium G